MFIRWKVIAMCAPVLPLLAFLLAVFVPDSPTYLISRQNNIKASLALKKMYGSQFNIEKQARGQLKNIWHCSEGGWGVGNKASRELFDLFQTLILIFKRKMTLPLHLWQFKPKPKKTICSLIWLFTNKITISISQFINF